MTNKRTWSIKQLEEAVNSNNTIAGILRDLNLKLFRGNYQTIYKYINMLNIDISHIDGKGKINNFNKKIPIEQLLIKDSTYDRGSVRRRIVKENVLEYKCKKCGLENTWQKEEIRLQLDHINGIWNDNRIENLRFLCPNCHSQTKNWSGRNNKKVDKKTGRCACGKSILKTSTFCHSCAAKRQKSKIDWPSVDELIERTNKTSFVAVAKELGVSDNAIRKRIKNYFND